MSKKRYITIQILPDDSSETWTIKLRYRFFEFLFYATIIALFAVALAAVKVTEINGKVLTANHLAAINRELIIKQEKMILLEQELALISDQEQKIRGIVETFVSEKRSDTTSDKNEDRLNRFSQKELDKFVADVHAIEKKSKQGSRFPSRDEIPDIWPVPGIVSQAFNNGSNPETRHEGVDIIAENNTLVMNTARGVVIQSGQDRDLGRFVKIDHANHVQTLYAHLSRSFVQVGDQVEKGSIVGTVGNSGNSFGPHLHYEISIKGKFVDPQLYLK